MRKLADQGRTVVLVTHATQNLDLCDAVAVLAPGGHLAYFGSPAAALAYFAAGSFADIYLRIEEGKEPASWARAFGGSPEYARFVAGRPRASGPRQFAVLTRRYLAIMRRDRKNLLLLLGQAPVIAVMIAGVYAAPIFETATGGAGNNYEARTLLFLLAMVAVWFGTNNAAREIVKEAAIYRRERRVGLGAAPTSPRSTRC